jgi:hypothetical protein
MAARVIEERDIVLSAHVVDRYRQRVLSRDDERKFSEIDSEIRQVILEGLAKSPLLDHKPKVFRMYAERRRQLPSSDRFLECGRIGFILRETPSGAWIVTTMLHRTGGTPLR